MRKIIIRFVLVFFIGIISYFTYIYYVPYSEGIRSGNLIKLSRKGVVMKTWEGELSQGISGGQIFSFSVLDKDKKVIEDLKTLQGNYVKLTYLERYKTFPWWGDTTYFVTSVKKEVSPFKIN